MSRNKRYESYDGIAYTILFHLGGPSAVTDIEKLQKEKTALQEAITDHFNRLEEFGSINKYAEEIQRSLNILNNNNGRISSPLKKIVSQGLKHYCTLLDQKKLTLLSEKIQDLFSKAEEKDLLAKC